MAFQPRLSPIFQFLSSAFPTVSQRFSNDFLTAFRRLVNGSLTTFQRRSNGFPTAFQRLSNGFLTASPSRPRRGYLGSSSTVDGVDDLILTGIPSCQIGTDCTDCGLHVRVFCSFCFLFLLLYLVLVIGAALCEEKLKTMVGMHLLIRLFNTPYWCRMSASTIVSFVWGEFDKFLVWRLSGFYQ